MPDCFHLIPRPLWDLCFENYAVPLSCFQHDSKNTQKQKQKHTPTTNQPTSQPANQETNQPTNQNKTKQNKTNKHIWQSEWALNFTRLQ